MPHDANGKEVERGDTVMVPCEVVMIHSEGDYCNVSLKTIHPMPPYTKDQFSRTTLNLNSRQVVLDVKR